MPWKLKRSNTFRTITIWALSFSLFNPYWFNVPFLYPRKWLTFSVGMKCVKTSKVVARRCSAKKVFWPRSLLKKRIQQFALHCVKSVRIQSECGKIRTRKTPNTDAFHAVIMSWYSPLKYAALENRRKLKVLLLTLWWRRSLSYRN